MSSPVILPSPSGDAPAQSPFVSTTTPTIERANRLISVRAHPGFLDIIRISQQIRDEATAVLVDFGGWDKDQVMVLKVRAQAAKEHHSLLLSKIQDAIQAGLDNASEITEAILTRTAEEAVDQGDFVRQKVLQRFDENDTSRVAGSY
jgi:ElaB/YqjD/DUF883 family membrane-anchored ribosome-binding protein